MDYMFPLMIFYGKLNNLLNMVDSSGLSNNGKGQGGYDTSLAGNADLQLINMGVDNCLLISTFS